MIGKRASPVSFLGWPKLIRRTSRIFRASTK